jgi:hypothetical protein
MKTETISKKSWHYRLATRYGAQSEFDLVEGDANICEYIRNMFMGLVLIAAIICVITLLSFLFIMQPMIYFLASILELGWHTPTTEMFVILTVESIAMIVPLIYLFSQSETYKRLVVVANTPTSEQPPSFVNLAYRKFKEKTCFRLQSVD